MAAAWRGVTRAQRIAWTGVAIYQSNHSMVCRVRMARIRRNARAPRARRARKHLPNGASATRRENMA